MAIYIVPNWIPSSAWLTTKTPKKVIASAILFSVYESILDDKINSQIFQLNKPMKLYIWPCWLISEIYH